MGEQERRVDEVRWGVIESVARACASSPVTFTHPDFGWHQRYDAALDGITVYVCDHGWPDGPLKPLYRAGTAEIMAQQREMLKHLRWGWGYWLPPSGGHDRIAEDITDRIGIHQACWALYPGEWEAVWAEAERIRRGEDRAFAAALLGISPSAFSARLLYARRRIGALWVAPGEHPRGRYHPQSEARRGAPGGGMSRSLYRRRVNNDPERREAAKLKARARRQRARDEAARDDAA